MDGFGYGHGTGSVTAPFGTAYVPVNFVFHAGGRPKDMYGKDDPFDMSAFLPAHEESQLRE